MNKKGFTLVELLAVIVILAVVSVIVFPNISSIIISSKQTLHDDQIKDILVSGEKWATDNNKYLDKYHINYTYISLSDLQNMGYLEKEEIKDPKTNTKMNGCVEISYNLENQKYNYAYEEKECSKMASDSKTSKDDHGYIIYYYDSASKEINKSDSSVLYVPFLDEILKNNTIHVDGEEIDGLYDIDDEYVFRGTNPNNYVKIIGKNEKGDAVNTLFRILSINKKDYKIKLIKATANASNKWNDSYIDYKSSSISGNLQSEDYGSNKIVVVDYLSGIINGDDYSPQTLKSTIESDSSKFTNAKIAIPSLYDFVNASASSACSDSYHSCLSNNFITTMLGSNSMWTLNDNGSQIWYVSSSEINVSNPNSIRQIYPVITMSSGTFNSKYDTKTNTSKATGSNTNPYELK